MQSLKQKATDHLIGGQQEGAHEGELSSPVRVVVGDGGGRRVPRASRRRRQPW